MLKPISQLLLAATLLGGNAFAQSEKDAIAIVERALAAAKAEGKDKVIERIKAKDAAFVNGELYVVLRDPSGTILAHPYKAALIGKNLNDVPDADGKLFRQEITDGAKKQGKGWVSYKSKNPTNGKIEAKKTYYQRGDGLIAEAGIYE